MTRNQHIVRKANLAERAEDLRQMYVEECRLVIIAGLYPGHEKMGDYYVGLCKEMYSTSLSRIKLPVGVLNPPAHLIDLSDGATVSVGLDELTIPQLQELLTNLLK